MSDAVSRTGRAPAASAPSMGFFERVDGELHFTPGQVARNDTIMVAAVASIVGLLLGHSSITVPWGTLPRSVVVYIVVPGAIA